MNQNGGCHNIFLRRAAQAKIHIHHLVNSFVSAFRTGEYVSAGLRYTFYAEVYNVYVSAEWTYTFQRCIIYIDVYLVSRYMYAFYWELYHTICCRQLGMHISGTHPSLPINCLYVCLMPILASGICFVYSSRHLVCITARHIAFGDICQQHRESSFLLISRRFFMLSVATPDVCLGVCMGNGMLTAVFDKYCLQNISSDFL